MRLLERELVSAHPAFQNGLLVDHLSRLSIMESLMTGLANHQRFPPLLFHEIGPAWHMSLFIDVQIGHFADMVHFASSYQVTEFASVCAESLGDLLAFGLIVGGSRIYQNGLRVPFQRKPTKASNQRLFLFASVYRDLQAPPFALGSHDGGLVAMEKVVDAGLVLRRQGMQE
jgi:hypothetical protein